MPTEMEVDNIQLFVAHSQFLNLYLYNIFLLLSFVGDGFSARAIDDGDGDVFVVLAFIGAIAATQLYCHHTSDIE